MASGDHTCIQHPTGILVDMFTALQSKVELLHEDLSDTLHEDLNSVIHEDMLTMHEDLMAIKEILEEGLGVP